MLVKMPNGKYIDPTEVAALETLYVGHESYLIQVLQKPSFNGYKITVAECKRKDVDETMAICANIINSHLE